MDEIDAALDFKNVSIVANYIKVSLVCYSASVTLFCGSFFSVKCAFEIFVYRYLLLLLLLCVGMGAVDLE